MKHTGDAFGRGCLWLSLATLYGLLAMRLYVAWREGLWLDWPLGDFVSDAVVRRVFALENAWLHRVAVWLLEQDVLYYAAAVSLVVWLLIPAGKKSAVDEEDDISR